MEVQSEHSGMRDTEVQVPSLTPFSNCSVMLTTGTEPCSGVCSCFVLRTKGQPSAVLGRTAEDSVTRDSALCGAGQDSHRFRLWLLSMQLASCLAADEPHSWCLVWVDVMPEGRCVSGEEH